jgi:hypothetical protein
MKDEQKWIGKSHTSPKASTNVTDKITATHSLNILSRNIGSASIATAFERSNVTRSWCCFCTTGRIAAVHKIPTSAEVILIKNSHRVGPSKGLHSVVVVEGYQLELYMIKQKKHTCTNLNQTNSVCSIGD